MNLAVQHSIEPVDRRRTPSCELHIDQQSAETHEKCTFNATAIAVCFFAAWRMVVGDQHCTTIVQGAAHLFRTNNQIRTVLVNYFGRATQFCQIKLLTSRPLQICIFFYFSIFYLMPLEEFATKCPDSANISHTKLTVKSSCDSTECALWYKIKVLENRAEERKQKVAKFVRDELLLVTGTCF